ncbi:MAG: redoxin family protein [Candidatus Omnitrophica bacterium]|nr:redoxin family protein [Candidatus Omnitrophota bacterium]
MKKNFLFAVYSLILLTIVPVEARDFPVDQQSSNAGGIISVHGASAQLSSGTLQVGDNFLDLVKDIDIVFPFEYRVTIVSTVPSIDTPVCELQTNQLANQLSDHPGIDVVTISRDLPYAQERFAKSSSITKIKFVSDYKTGSFGLRTGLMIKNVQLLARSLVVLDKKGNVRYMQVVPELSHLPDIAKAVTEAVRIDNLK